MRIILTGASGFIGRHLVKCLISRGHFVNAIYLNNKPNIGESNELVNWSQCDIRKGLDKSIKGSDFDCIINLASVGISPRTASLKQLIDVNVLTAALLFEFAEQRKIKRLVFTGSCHEYGISGNKYKQIPTSAELLPNNLYGASKAASYNMIYALSQISRKEVFYGRIFSVYGHGQHKSNLWPQIFEAAKELKDLKLSTGNQIRDFISVENVCKILAYAVERKDLNPGSIMLENIGSGKAKSVYEFATEEYRRLGGEKRVMLGAVEDRPNEVNSYCAEVPPHYKTLLG